MPGASNVSAQQRVERFPLAAASSSLFHGIHLSRNTSRGCFKSSLMGNSCCFRRLSSIWLLLFDFIFKQYNVKHRNTAHRTDGVLSQTDSRAALAGDTGVGEESQTARLLKANKLSVNRESNEGRKNKSESGTKSDPSVTPSLKTGEQKWRDFHNRVRILAY